MTLLHGSNIDIYIMILSSSKSAVMKKQQKQFHGGGTMLTGRSIRKDESHCSRQSCLCLFQSFPLSKTQSDITHHPTQRLVRSMVSITRLTRRRSL